MLAGTSCPFLASGAACEDGDAGVILVRAGGADLARTASAETKTAAAPYRGPGGGPPCSPFGAAS